jgi:uncharacterized protein
MEPDKALLNELVRRIVEAVHPLEIILFGSAARGQMGPESDLDVLVVMPDGAHRLHTTGYIYQQLFGFGFPKDIVVATPADLREHADNPGLIYRQILREGKVLYRATA